MFLDSRLRGNDGNDGNDGNVEGVEGVEGCFWHKAIGLAIGSKLMDLSDWI